MRNWNSRLAISAELDRKKSEEKKEPSSFSCFWHHILADSFFFILCLQTPPFQDNYAAFTKHIEDWVNIGLLLWRKQTCKLVQASSGND